MLSLYGAMRDQKREPGLVLKGELFYGLMRHSVDGWNFDTYYSVRGGWAEDSQIIRSLAGLANPDIFDRERTIQAEDGLYLGRERQSLSSLDDDPFESDSVHGKDVNK